MVMGIFHPQEEDYRWININAIPLFKPGEPSPYQVYTTFNDITDRKRAEDRLQASLREKEMLLKEIHHRVKNNLQVIASLLDLQAESIQDPAVLHMFQESRNRVRAMGLVHEQLYRSQDLSRISAARYVPDLVNHLLSIYGSTAVAVDTSIQVEDLHLSVDTAIPCGLLITELVSNAFKHAFPSLEARSWDGGESRQVHVELKADGDERIRLVVRDNGIGLPPHLDWRRTPSLGLQLVDLLSHQIHGSVELDQTLGTAFTITFTDPNR
jgi:two-component sensor histidine kinase